MVIEYIVLVTFCIVIYENPEEYLGGNRDFPLEKGNVLANDKEEQRMIRKKLSVKSRQSVVTC